MFDPASPLYIPPRWDPELWRWLISFARNCTDAQVAAAMSVMGPMGHETLRLFDALTAEEVPGCGYRREGYYEVCFSDEGFAAARAEADAIRPYMYDPEFLDEHEMRCREPALGPGVTGAVFYPQAATVDPLAFVRGLAGAAAARGVRIEEGAEVVDVGVVDDRVTGVRRADGSFTAADAVVLATGPFSLDLAARAGTSVPVQPGKGYHRDVAAGDSGGPALRAACVLRESSVFCTPLPGRVRFAGTMEFSGENRVLRPERLVQIERAARAAFPALGHEPVVSEWCGLRPVSADGLPIVGPVPGISGAWMATGHGMLGLTLGPVTGAWLADAVLGGTPHPHMLALSPARFHR
jgi:D-amino-acid dehydrogenase